MSRPIDADALIPKLKAIYEAENQIYRRESWGFALKCINAVEDAPTIVPGRKKGHWIPQDYNIKHGMITTTAYFYPKCSRCGNSDNYTNFCSKCGADMRG